MAKRYQNHPVFPRFEVPSLIGVSLFDLTKISIFESPLSSTQGSDLEHQCTSNSVPWTSDYSRAHVRLVSTLPVTPIQGLDILCMQAS